MRVGPLQGGEPLDLKGGASLLERALSPWCMGILGVPSGFSSPRTSHTQIFESLYHGPKDPNNGEYLGNSFPVNHFHVNSLRQDRRPPIAYP